MDDDRGADSPGLLKILLRGMLGKRRARSEEELQEIIDASEKEGIINEEEGEMLHSIFELGDTIVREIMVPRTEMDCCSIDASINELLSAINSSGHSKIPVYRNTADEIVGIVHAKDLLRFWSSDESTVHLSDIMRKPFFVPEAMTLEQLLKEFRRKRVHIAIAIDEYGGTSGMVTFADLIEEIVGEVSDEDDLDEPRMVEESEGVLLVDGRLNVEELEEYFDITITKEKFDTVAGWVSHLFGHVPQEGEEVVAENLKMRVVVADPRKIQKVRVETDLPETSDAESVE
ncbi:MAG: HlyC/CorC family transporter [Deltaproteobacteria bacterium]|nr:HlyC/CorC family transporter [Deltaproteobacteria bacterium]